MFTIVSKLLQDKALEEGEEYEYIPIHPLGPGDHSTPRKKGGPAAPEALPYELKPIPMQELQQLLNYLQQEMKNQHDASLGSVHDILSPSDIIEGWGTKDQYPQVIHF